MTSSDPVIAELKACDPVEKDELKPCPNVICDLSRPHLEQDEEGMPVGHTWVQCEHCGACGPRIDNPSAYYGRTEHWESAKAEAIEAWNSRVSTPPPGIEPEAADHPTAAMIAAGQAALNAVEHGNSHRYCYRTDGEITAIYLAMHAAIQSLRSEQEGVR